MSDEFVLTCYVHSDWRPRIRAASPRRDWMDRTPEAFAYRCLPLNIANAHGWELLSPCGFEAEWNGGATVDDVVVRPDPGTPPQTTHPDVDSLTEARRLAPCRQRPDAAPPAGKPSTFIAH